MSSDEWTDRKADEAAEERREGVNEIPVDRAVRALLHRRRRRVVRYLMDCPDERARADEVVEAVLTAEGRSGSPERSREAVGVDVRRVQLPHLEEAGIVEYDADAGRIRYLPAPRIELLVECIEGL